MINFSIKILFTPLKPSVHLSRAFGYRELGTSCCNTISPRIDGWINLAECLYELHGAEKAVEALLLDEERFKEVS